MEFAELQPDLQKWIRDAVRNGQQLTVMVDALLKAGYQPSIEHAVRQYISDPEINLREGQGASLRKDAFDGVQGVQGDGLCDDGSRFRLFEPVSNRIKLGDRQVDILLSMRQPNVILFGNLLADWECDALIEMSRPQMAPSRVVNSENGAYDLRDVRTSFGTYFKTRETPLVAAIEARISHLLGVPESRGEPLQILHYQPGAEYRPHYDFFNPEHPGNSRVLSMGGQRMGTVIMYLNDVVSGGSTVFPRLNLDILPRKGCGLFFSYANDQGDLDYQTLHGGSPVLEGEKWIATKWLRLGDFVGRSE
ncbi:2OG-Fe(II) oxygenase [Microbulbifer pacificus]|uniref:2OG-Fe(II) oxygenase n=1 Tax=Microbulbifer pacificus TaxID=407164 RepID=UPI00131A409F|nr:2OG-Fe(II) oxygenase [Microbulbifer pacificus]